MGGICRRRNDDDSAGGDVFYFVRSRWRVRPAIEPSDSAFDIVGLGKSGAQERTRTFTAVKPLAPEASASTNSATWARAG